MFCVVIRRQGVFAVFSEALWGYKQLEQSSSVGYLMAASVLKNARGGARARVKRLVELVQACKHLLGRESLSSPNPKTMLSMNES